MTPEAFIAKWRGVDLSELAASHDHFNELCELLDIRKPTDDDPTGERFAFEKPVPKAGKAGGAGFADVWRKSCFVWEYKRKNKYTTLAAAIAQAREYAALLDNPPLAIACDIDQIQIRTLFTGSVSVTHTILLGELNDGAKRQLLRRCFTDPHSLRPDITPQAVTEEAARKFATLAQNLRERRDRIGQLHDARRVAHFLNKIVFCLFAEDAGLLPGNVFSAIVEESMRDKSGLSDMLADLFDKMRTGKGRFGTVAIPWFNGGLFDDDDVLDLLFTEVQTLAEATRLDWASIEPVIFGTLFERGLDPAKRKEMAGLFDAASPSPKPGRKKKSDSTNAPAALPLRGGANAVRRSLGKGVGIHYTASAMIMKIVEPVVLRPLAAEWETVKKAIRMAKQPRRKDDLYFAFRERLGAFRVLDPACGSGNFLYLALRHLKDFDRLVEEEAKALGAAPDPRGQRITPRTVLGIEINPYAAELARVTVWIGELQWQLRNGYGITRRPILGSLDGIENRDALLNADGTQAKWPKTSVIVGNPPFLGGKKLLSVLGKEYIGTLRRAFAGELPAFTDFVTYWIEKARRLVEEGQLEIAGLVATNSIRGGSNLPAMRKVVSSTDLFCAWSDEPWTLDGAAVRVALLCFAHRPYVGSKTLDGIEAKAINADLTAGTTDLTRVHRLPENAETCFEGGQKHGPFEVPAGVARSWLVAPVNPNGRSNADVLMPLVNAADLVRRSSDTWVVNFGDRSERDSALYELPFKYVVEHVKPERMKSALASHRQYWWRHHRTRPEIRSRAANLRRYIATPVISKHRIFAWLSSKYWPSNLLDVILRDDDVTFGLLHSRSHELWALRLGTSLEDRPRYTPSTTFETFPFPNGLTPQVEVHAINPQAERIGAAAAKLNELREKWLNPADLVKCVPEAVPDFPDRIVPKNLAAGEQLKTRTLTNLYNERPTWLAHAHRDLDRAVAAAYGWPEALADSAQPENPDAADRRAAEDEMLKRLFDLNQERTETGR